MPRKSARQLQKSAHALMLRKGNSRRLESIRSQPSLSHSCQYLRTLTYCHDDCLYQDLLHFYDPNDMTDLLVGEEFDNLVDVDDVEEMEMEDIDVALKDITRFWNCTINWAKVDLSFPRVGEGERQLRRKRKFNREKDSSMPKNAIL